MDALLPFEVEERLLGELLQLYLGVEDVDTLYVILEDIYFTGIMILEDLAFYSKLLLKKFGPKKCLGPKKMFSEGKSWPKKKFSLEKIFLWSFKICVEKMLVQKNVFVPKIFWSKHFLIPKKISHSGCTRDILSSIFLYP